MWSMNRNIAECYSYLQYSLANPNDIETKLRAPYFMSFEHVLSEIGVKIGDGEGLT
jgi:hypothetical protein